jgi:zinc protease
MRANTRIERSVQLLAAVLCFSAEIAFATPNIQNWQSASGAKVLFVEDHNIPMLDVSVSFPAGSSYDTSDSAGVASMTLHLLDTGVAGMNEDEISRGMADIGAVLGGAVDQDRASITLRTLSSDDERNRAIEIMSRVVQQPLFPETILAREKTRLIAALKEAETKPESIAEKAFQKAVYGSHPYALPVSGDVASIEKITVQDLKDFYQLHYNARSTVIAIMGDVSRAQAEAIAQQLTAKLPADNTVVALSGSVAKIAAGERRIAHPASQSHILIGAPGM